MPTKPTRRQLRRRIQQLERCLDFVTDWCRDQFIDLNAHGADRPGNQLYRDVQRLKNRIARTL